MISVQTSFPRANRQKPKIVGLLVDDLERESSDRISDNNREIHTSGFTWNEQSKLWENILKPQGPSLENGPTVNFIKEQEQPRGEEANELKTMNWDEVASVGKEAASKTVGLAVNTLFDLFGVFRNIFVKDVLGLGEKKTSLEQKIQQSDATKDTKQSWGFFEHYRRFIQNVNSDFQVILGRKREDVNRKLKMNLSFEGTVDNSGRARVDVEAQLDRINSELKEKELKKKRETILMQTKKVAKKSNPLAKNLNAQEGQSLVANQITTAG